MAFKFDKELAMKPVKVSWRLSASTVAAVEEMAKELDVKAEQIADQALGQALAGWQRRRAAPGGAGEGPRDAQKR